MSDKRKKVVIIGLILILICIMIYIFSYKISEYKKKNNDIKKSENIELAKINLGIIENGELIVDNSNSGDETQELEGTLLTKTFSGEFKIGKTYSERIAVKNTGTVEQHLQVVIYKYYIDENGEKTINLSPETIKLNLTNTNVWTINEEDSDSQRIVLYYNQSLKPEEITPEFIDSISIDSEIYNQKSITKTTNTEGYETLKTTYNCNGFKFVLDISITAQQAREP
ncbi:MAG: hypothetical protein HFJ55_00650 [Clostridia bacterium]|nr:hypothetical protein [Clostridia bacterium]